jgi:hypothetical protein
MSSAIQNLNPTNSGKAPHDQLQKGDRYRCQQCGIEIEVAVPSNCGANAPANCCDSTKGVFQCFGHVMEKV